VAATLDATAGDVVLVPDPAYPYYGNRVRLLGGSVRRISLGPPGVLDRDALADVDDSVAAVAINTPNNPTGAVYDAATMAGVAEAAERVDAHLISDEVYAPFDRSGWFTSARTVTQDSVLVGGFSKSLAVTGLRVGYGVFPPALLETARRYHRLCTLTASRPAQSAVLATLESLNDGQELHDLVSDHRDRLAERTGTLREALAVGGAGVVAPDGGFYVLADLPDVPGTVDGVRTLIDRAGVAAMPGSVFGETTAGHVRFSLVSPRVETAARRLQEWFTER